MNQLEEFKKLARSYYEFIYRSFPELATYYGVHRYDSKLTNFSGSNISRIIGKLELYKKTFMAFAREFKKWPLADQVDYRYLLSEIESYLLNWEEIKDWQKSPTLYLETPLMGIFLLFIRNHRSAKVVYKNVTSRLSHFHSVLSQGKRNLSRPSRIQVEVGLETLAGAGVFLDGLPTYFKGRLGKRDLENLKASCQRVKRSLKVFEEFLRLKMLPSAKDDFALGKRLFAKKLKVESLLNQDPDKIYRFGLSSFKRIEGELKSLAKKLDRKKTWQELVEEYRNLTPKKENLLGSYRREVKKLAKFLKKKKIVSFPPKERCLTVETPLFERPTIPYAAYMPPGPFEKDQTGIFWVTTIEKSSELTTPRSGVPLRRENSEMLKVNHYEQLKEHNIFAYPITTLHEAYPGHHLQFSLANRHPSFIRKHAQSSLYCEGWALYCEQMMGETGYYKDERIRLFVLKDELWRAARVIIDVSLHCSGMTIDQATELLVKKVKLAPDQAQAEVKRYTVSPTQPLTYLVGKHLILNLRKKAKVKWGRSFSLKRFHDLFLSFGTVPLPLVEGEFFGERARSVDGEGSLMF